MNVAIPRDRNGEYEPQLIKKYQNTVTQDMEEKILSMPMWIIVVELTQAEQIYTPMHKCTWGKRKAHT